MNPTLDPAEVAAAYASDKVLARIARDRAAHESKEVLRVAAKRAEIAAKESALKALENQKRITAGLIANTKTSIMWAKKKLKPSSLVPTRLGRQQARRKRRIRDIIIKRKQRELKTSISRQWYEVNDFAAPKTL